MEQKLDIFTQAPLSLTALIINLGAGVFLSLLLRWHFKHFGSTLSNREEFSHVCPFILLTTILIITVVKSSLALSLGLVGALSIVRFRTPIKEPEELAYLFFAIGIGIGLGDNQRLITLLALVIGIIIIGLNKLLRRAEADVNLHLSIASQQPAKVELEQIESVLRQHTAKMKLLRFDETAEMLEAGFLVEFQEMGQLNVTKQELRALSENIEITFMDNKGVW